MANKITSTPSLKELCLLGNYVEIIMLDTANDTDIADRVFSKMLMSIKKTHSGCFQKHYKEFVFRNLFYENNEQNQIKTYKKTLKYVGNMDDGMKIMVYHKEKLPYHSFPCTTKLHSICYISKAVLNNYRLDFTIYSPIRKCGCADIVKDNGYKVWGLVYELTEKDLKAMDVFEGHPIHYKRIKVIATNGAGKNIEVETYEVVNKFRKLFKKKVW